MGSRFSGVDVCSACLQRITIEATARANNQAPANAATVIAIAIRKSALIMASPKR
jgi:hypothetical protein